MKQLPRRVWIMPVSVMQPMLVLSEGESQAGTKEAEDRAETSREGQAGSMVHQLAAVYPCKRLGCPAARPQTAFFSLIQILKMNPKERTVTAVSKAAPITQILWLFRRTHQVQSAGIGGCFLPWLVT